MPEAIHHFPKDFKWGTATAAHQVEGNNTNNQWAVWEQTPGNIHGGDRAGLACDWWRNAEADFDRMVELSLNAHRLSVEWSRIEPREGYFDDAAIDRYRQMLLGLRRRGIEPMVTLHHFTNPIWLEEQGAWENVQVVPKFERFVIHVVRSLGDLCDVWCTINEPNIYAVMGYLTDDSHMPPGRPGNFDLTLRVIRNMLLAHAAAYRALHNVQPLARVGLAHHMREFQPLRPNHVLDHLVNRLQDNAFNQGILDALMHGRWGLILGRGAEQSARAVRGTLDWIGLNYYSRTRAYFDPRQRSTLFGAIIDTPGGEMSDYDYGEIYPDGLLHCLRRLARFKLPIYVTENGLPDEDDDQRPAFIVRHLRVLWAAIQFNYKIQGYYHWSLIDNFEWGQGWRMKFGLYALNPHTQERTPRRSAFLYRDIAKVNALSSDIVREYTPELLPTLFP
ncbi:MAG: glycoside hydrolase family 1 protein [Thermoflexales bacterium]|nr:glycoside hydrolase family 1 protein [Thermoflexales bacterium]